jgi:hypothetical protein
MWNERIARECAYAAAEKLLAGSPPQERDERHGFVQLTVEIAIQQYVQQLQAHYRRLAPLKHEQNGRGR